MTLRTMGEPAYADRSLPLLAHRSLIWNFGQRDLKARFKGTALGWVWSLAVPLASLAIYSLVFSVIFRAAPPALGDGRPGIFFVWLFCGLTAWSFFNQAVLVGMASLLGSGPLLKKIYFPSYAPVLGAIVAVGIQSLIEFGLLMVLLAIIGNVSWTWLLTPLWGVLFLAFCSGAAVAMAVLNVYFRDLTHIISVALQLMFYLTPIIYPITLIPAVKYGIPVRTIIQLNPLSEFIKLFRALVYDLTPGSALTWLGCLIWTVIGVVVGRWMYARRGRDLSEEL